MLRRIGVTVLIWICLLCPFYCGINYIEHTSSFSVKECLNTFLHTENNAIVHSIAFQMENDVARLKSFAESISSGAFKDQKKITKIVTNFLKHNENILSIKIGNSSGSLIYTSDKYDNSDFLHDADFKNAQNGKVVFKLFDKDKKSKTIAISYFFAIDKKITDDINTEKPNAARQSVEAKQENGERQKHKDQKIFFQITLPWSEYHSNLSSIRQGTFPRFFYILSPNFTRHVNLDGIFIKNSQKRLAVSLGCHLAAELKEKELKENTILFKKYNIPFLINIEKINIKDDIVGPALYSAIATDSTSISVLANELLDGVNGAFIFGFLFTLLLALIMGRKYSNVRESLSISESISESTPVPVLIFEMTSGKIIRTNEPSCILFKEPQENFIGKDGWSIFINDKDKKYVKNAVDSGIPIRDYELLLQTSDGGTFWSVLSVSPIYIRGKLCAVIGASDISHRKEIERKMENNARMLEKQIQDRTRDLKEQAASLEDSNRKLETAKKNADLANKAKSVFLRNMSNELKTPLNSIIGYSDILIEEAKERGDDVSAGDLRRIIGSANHLLAIINEILNLPDIEEGKVRFNMKNFNVIDVIQDVDGVSRPLFINNDNTFIVECPDDIGAMHCDKTKLSQCLLNLLSNAAKFTERGEVTLRVRDIFENDENFIEFLVRDNGVGIDSNELKNLLTAMEIDSSKPGNGIGLGLAMTKKYCELLGGKLLIDSEKGEGSNFTILLPRICKDKKEDEFIVQPIPNETHVEIFRDADEEIEKSIIEVEGESSDSVELEDPATSLKNEELWKSDQEKSDLDSAAADSSSSRYTSVVFEEDRDGEDEETTKSEQ